MRWTNKLLAALGATLISSAVQAVPAAQLRENYQSIIERNPFGLKPPPPPATNAPPEVKDKAKVEVFLTGITSIGYPRLPKQAYFYTREQGKKDLTYYSLTEGTSKDGIQVLTIDPDRRKVKIKMENSETLLSFETHGVPVAAVAAKPGTPGLPGVPTIGQPGLPQPAVQPAPNIPQPGAVPTYDANGQPVYNQTAQPTVQPVNNAGTGLRQIPSRRIRGGGSGNPNYGSGQPPMNAIQQPQEQQPYNLAEDYVRMHLNRAAAEQQGVVMPPLPSIEQ